MSRIESNGILRQREPRVRDKAYLGFVAGCKCIVCAVYGITRRPVEVAHCKTGYPQSGWRSFGISEKAHDGRTTPLCALHHREGPQAQHKNVWGGERNFWEHHGIYPPDFCEALYAAFQAGDNGERVVDEFAARARAQLAQRRAAGNL